MKMLMLIGFVKPCRRVFVCFAALNTNIVARKLDFIM